MTHEEIIAAVESMTVLELADLVKAMEEKFGVSAAATAVVAGPAAGAAAPAAEEKTEFDVVLKSFDAAAKLKVLKLVREVCGLGLKEAKDFVEAVGLARRPSRKACPRKTPTRWLPSSRKSAANAKSSNSSELRFAFLQSSRKAKRLDACIQPLFYAIDTLRLCSP